MKYALSVENVSKVFPSQKAGNFAALSNVTVNIEKGDCFGIIGPNGSGKTTLLKILGGLIEPSKGEVHANGKILRLLDLGAGLNDELSGRENIYLYGSLIGISKSDIQKNFDKIIEFSNLKNFIDYKLKEYSNGMILRLAFSVIIISNADILLIDEALAVGDHEFQSRCVYALKLLKEKKKTIVLVSHDMSLVEALCNKAIFLKNGRIENFGTTKKVICSYLTFSSEHEFKTDYYNIINKEKELNKIALRKERKSIFSVFRKELTKDSMIFFRKVELLDEINKLIRKTGDYLEAYLANNKPNKNILERVELMKNILAIKKNLEPDKDMTDFEFFLNFINCLDDDSGKKLDFDETCKYFLYKIGKSKSKKEVISSFRHKMNNLFASDLGSKENYYMLEKYRNMVRPYLKEIEKDDPGFVKNLNIDLEFATRNVLFMLDNEYDYCCLSFDEAKTNKNIIQANETGKKIKELETIRENIIKKFIIKKNNKTGRDIEIKKLEVYVEKSSSKRKFSQSESISINIYYESKKSISDAIFSVSIEKSDGTIIGGPNSASHQLEIRGKGKMQCVLENKFLPGIYVISATIHARNSYNPLCTFEKAEYFIITGEKINTGDIRINSSWKITDN